MLMIPSSVKVFLASQPVDMTYIPHSWDAISRHRSGREAKDRIRQIHEVKNLSVQVGQFRLEHADKMSTLS